MSRTITTRELERALLRKGFVRFHGGKHVRLMLVIDGEPVGVQTFASRSNYSLNSALLHLIAQQLRMPSIAFVRKFLECEVSLQAYLELLRSQGLI